MDYSHVTEVPGDPVTLEALSMMRARYGLAAEVGANRDVLEVACGAGPGLGWLARTARRIVGGDCSPALLAMSRRHYGDRIPLVRLDAQALPFRADSFDVVLLYEALYYLGRPGRFVAESRRVLRRDGTLLLCTVNPDWTGFNPSPLSTRYFAARELAALLRAHQFVVELYGAFAVAGNGLGERLRSMLKRWAVRFHLIPKTMRGKAVLKRVFLGRLVPVPAEVEPTPAATGRLVPMPEEVSMEGFKVIYAVARVRG